MRRTERLKIRFTPEEMDDLIRSAEDATSLASWCRDQLLRKDQAACAPNEAEHRPDTGRDAHGTGKGR
jgi:hypothetical protein